MVCYEVHESKMEQIKQRFNTRNNPILQKINLSILITFLLYSKINPNSFEYCLLTSLDFKAK